MLALVCFAEAAGVQRVARARPLLTSRSVVHFDVALSGVRTRSPQVRTLTFPARLPRSTSDAPWSWRASRFRVRSPW